MFDSLSSRGSSPGTHPQDWTAARLAAQRQAIHDIADWFRQVPDCAAHSFCTLTLTLAFEPCAEKETATPTRHASCRWTASVGCTPDAVTPPAGKTSAFGPSSHFTLLSEQYYEAAGTARGEDTTSQELACADAQKRAHQQAMESAGKAGLCDREGSAMRIAISFAPPTPALLGGGRYDIGSFEALCDWNLVIEAVTPEPGDLQPNELAGSVLSDSSS